MRAAAASALCAAPAALASADADTVRTPFGAVHRSCVRGLPSGALLEEAADGASVRVMHANGTVEIVASCAHELRALRPRRAHIYKQCRCVCVPWVLRSTDAGDHVAAVR